MVRWAKLDIRRERIPSLDEVEEARANVFFERIRVTLEEKKFILHDRIIDRLLDQGYSSTDISSALIHLLQNAAPVAPVPAAKKSATPAMAERDRTTQAALRRTQATRGAEASRRKGRARSPFRAGHQVERGRSGRRRTESPPCRGSRSTGPIRR